MNKVINKRNLMIGIFAAVILACVFILNIKPDVKATGYNGLGAEPIYGESTVVHHDAVTHEEKIWVVDQAAWDETVVTGYVCSGCGATK